MQFTLAEVQFFDIQQDFAVHMRHLPHWSQAGTLCFITWRAQDSIPTEFVNRWHRERADWLQRQGIHIAKANWRQRLSELSPELQCTYHRLFTDRWNEWLDSGFGAAVLRDHKLAEIVGKSLMHFDGDRYLMTDYVVMPTHVHVLAAFPNEDAMLLQCESWKHFTATQINRLIGSKGRFWQEDEFDHLVRNEMQYQHFRKYIATNPAAANLRHGEFLHYSKELSERTFVESHHAHLR
jgi:type I restriction enzyme R subunit